MGDARMDWMTPMKRPWMRRVWNAVDNYPGPTPVVERVIGVIVLPWHMVRHTIEARGGFTRGAQDSRPESWRWCVGLAWLYWRHWYWVDWTPSCGVLGAEDGCCPSPVGSRRSDDADTLSLKGRGKGEVGGGAPCR